MVSVIVAAAVAVAGGLGAGARYTLDGLITHRSRRTLPIATLIINVTGSFLLGALTGWIAARGESAGSLIAGVGFLGGFTTFSTASVELVGLVRARRPWAALLLGTLMVFASLAAAGAGIVLMLWATG